MPRIKAVMDYSRLDFFSVLELPADTFQLMFKNWFIDRCNESEEGQKYLKDCERYATTEADMDAIRKMKEYRIG